MKFCQNCGSKCVAVNGQPAKFCGECGESFGDTAKSIAKENIDTPKLGNFDDMTAENSFTFSAKVPKMSFKSVAESEKGSGIGRTLS